MRTLLIVSLNMAILLSSCTDNGKSALYEGEDLSGTAQIIRDKNTKQAYLEVSENINWSLFAGASVESIDFSAPLAEGNDSGKFQLDVPTSTRSYFQLVTDKGRAILAERHLPMAGGYNFRDLGGIRTADGRYVKWGKIFRSDDLHNLTEADLGYLSSIPIISIVDFRSESETQAAPDKIPSSTLKDYQYHISPGNLAGAARSITDIDPAAIDSLMSDINIQLMTDSAHVERYGDFFGLLQDDSKIPLLFHCSAGKDRTGMGAALILFALGVDEETIMRDYLSSNEYLADKYSEYTTEYPGLKSLFVVKEEFIGAGLDRVKKDHGSVENYLRKELGVDIEKFREMYLY